MITVDYRTPNDLDYEAARKGSGSMLRNTVFALAVFSILGGVIFVVSHSLVGAAMVSGALFASSIISNLKFFSEMARRRRLTGDSKAVEVIDVGASRVLEIEPVGTGAAYVFFVGSDQAVLLNGQWQLEFTPFPVANFKLHVWADTKKPIRIEGSGDLIFPEKSNAIIRPEYVIGDVELFKASPDTLQEDMDVVFGKSRCPVQPSNADS